MEPACVFFESKKGVQVGARTGLNTNSQTV